MTMIARLFTILLLTLLVATANSSLPMSSTARKIRRLQPGSLEPSHDLLHTAYCAYTLGDGCGENCRINMRLVVDR